MSRTPWPGAVDFLKIWGEEAGRACLPRRFWSVSGTGKAGGAGRSLKCLGIRGGDLRQEKATGEREERDSSVAAWRGHVTQPAAPLQPRPPRRTLEVAEDRQAGAFPLCPLTARSRGQHLVPAKACQESACERARAVHSLLLHHQCCSAL